MSNGSEVCMHFCTTSSASNFDIDLLQYSEFTFVNVLFNNSAGIPLLLLGQIETLHGKPRLVHTKLLSIFNIVHFANMLCTNNTVDCSFVAYQLECNKAITEAGL